MKNFGIFVIKPDALNKHDLTIIQDVLTNYGFTNALYFRMPDYYEIMKLYRETDIRLKNHENAEVEIKSCGVALSAYQQLFGNADGIVVLIPLKKESFEMFYEKAEMAKREIRKQIEGGRGYYFAYVDYLTNPKLTKLSHEEYRHLKDKNKDNINRAYINGIHLEDYDCLVNNYCLNFMVANGVISKSNKIDINEYVQNLNNETIY